MINPTRLPITVFLLCAAALLAGCRVPQPATREIGVSDAEVQDLYQKSTARPSGCRIEIAPVRAWPLKNGVGVLVAIRGSSDGGKARSRAWLDGYDDLSSVLRMRSSSGVEVPVRASRPGLRDYGYRGVFGTPDYKSVGPANRVFEGNAEEEPVVFQTIALLVDISPSDYTIELLSGAADALCPGACVSKETIVLKVP